MIYDPPRQLDVFGSAAAYFGLEQLPGAQNVVSPQEPRSAEVGLRYTNTTSARRGRPRKGHRRRGSRSVPTRRRASSFPSSTAGSTSAPRCPGATARPGSTPMPGSPGGKTHRARSRLIISARSATIMSMTGAEALPRDGELSRLRDRRDRRPPLRQGDRRDQPAADPLRRGRRPRPSTSATSARRSSPARWRRSTRTATSHRYQNVGGAARPRLHRRAAGCRWCCRSAPPRASRTAITARPNGSPRSRSCRLLDGWLDRRIRSLGARAGPGARAARRLRLARRVHADAPPRARSSCLSLAGSPRCRLPGQRRMLDTLPIGFSNYSRFIAPWIEEAIKGAGRHPPLPLQPHRLQARRGAYRLRHRRRLLGRREYHLPDLLPPVRHRHLAGPRARHRGDARHDAAIFAAIAHEFAERESRERGGRVRFPLLVVRARLSRRRVASTWSSTSFPTGRCWR